MKTYVKPALTDVSLGKIEVDDSTYEVVGVVPFLAAAAVAATAVAKAVEKFDDHHLDYQRIGTFEEVA